MAEVGGDPNNGIESAGSYRDYESVQMKPDCENQAESFKSPQSPLADLD